MILNTCNQVFTVVKIANILDISNFYFSTPHTYSAIYTFYSSLQNYNVLNINKLNQYLFSTIVEIV